MELRSQRQGKEQHIFPLADRDPACRNTRFGQIIDRNDQEDCRDQIKLSMHITRIQNDRGHKVQHQYVLASGSGDPHQIIQPQKIHDEHRQFKNQIPHKYRKIPAQRYQNAAHALHKQHHRWIGKGRKQLIVIIILIRVVSLKKALYEGNEHQILIIRRKKSHQKHLK